MLITHPGSSTLSAKCTALPALIKREDTEWQTETPTYPPDPTLVPPMAVEPSKFKNKNFTSKQTVFICTELHCGKQFRRSFALRRHMRIHTGTKPYECDYEGCTQRFNTSGNLSRHKRIHSGERPYSCLFDTCDKRFNTSTKLKRHMRIHFPDGQSVFRCVDQVNCNWSCDNYKEFAQHQKLYHNIVVGAQKQPYVVHQTASTPTIAGSAEKDNDYFSTADSTREYHHLPHGNNHGIASSGTFLYPNTSSFDKAKSSVLASPPVRNKFIMPSAFLGLSDHNSLRSMLPRDEKKSDLDHLYGSDNRRIKPNVIMFPPAQYSTTSGLVSINSVNRSSFTNTSHILPHRREEESDGSGYEQQRCQQHQIMVPPSHHVLRPLLPTSEDSKYGGFAAPPPMNPTAPEFTGEELSVVLQLMNETY